MWTQKTGSRHVLTKSIWHQSAFFSIVVAYHESSCLSSQVWLTHLSQLSRTLWPELRLEHSRTIIMLSTAHDLCYVWTCVQIEGMLSHVKVLSGLSLPRGYNVLTTDCEACCLSPPHTYVLLYCLVMCGCLAD